MPRAPATAEQRRAQAMRQARWEQAHAGEFERLNLKLTPGTKAKLQRMAKRYGLKSITQLIEAIARVTRTN